MRSTAPLGVVGIGFALVLALPGCRGDSPSTLTQPSAPVAGVTVVGTSNAVKAGDTAQFQATATMTNGTSETVTTRAKWESSDQAIATVTAAGFVTAVANGQAMIRATYEGVTGSVRVTVADPAPVSTTFSVSGTISDAVSSAPIAGASVTVDGIPAFAVTDGNGRYRFTGLKEGKYTLRVAKTGYAAAQLSVVVSGDTLANLTLTKTGG